MRFCQECDKPILRVKDGVTTFECDSVLMPDGMFIESPFCIRVQRDQLRQQKQNLGKLVRRLLHEHRFDEQTRDYANGLLVQYFKPMDAVRS